MSEETLIQKLTKASSKIKAIGKDGRNTYQNYTFQSESAIKAAVKRAIESVGITIIPSFTITDQRDIKGNKGKIAHIVDVLGSFVITDGNDKITGQMPGSGLDNGEKATAKACTSAQKYFYKQLFNISDRDEDPDATDSNMGQPAPQQNGYRRQPQQPTRGRQQSMPQNSQRSNQAQRAVNDSLENKYKNAVAQYAAIMKISSEEANAEIKKVLEVDKDYMALRDKNAKINKATNVVNIMIQQAQNGGNK